jgi:hypothetical protein
MMMIMVIMGHTVLSTLFSNTEMVFQNGVGRIFGHE